MSAENSKKPHEKKQESGESGKLSAKQAAWTPERRAAQAERIREAARRRREGKLPQARKSKGDDEARVLGVATFLKFAAGEVFQNIREGEITLRTLTRKDALIILAYVDAKKLV